MVLLNFECLYTQYDTGTVTARHGTTRYVAFHTRIRNLLYSLYNKAQHTRGSATTARQHLYKRLRALSTGMFQNETGTRRKECVKQIKYEVKKARENVDKKAQSLGIKKSGCS